MASPTPTASAPPLPPLTLLLSSYPRVSSGSIDKGYYGKSKFFCQFHDSECFSIAFWVGLAKIATYSLLCCPSLLMPDKTNSAPSIETKSSHDSRIICCAAISVDFHKILNHILYVIQSIGPLGVASHLNDVQRSKMRADLGPFSLYLFS